MLTGGFVCLACFVWGFLCVFCLGFFGGGGVAAVAGFYFIIAEPLCSLWHLKCEKHKAPPSAKQTRQPQGFDSFPINKELSSAHKHLDSEYPPTAWGDHVMLTSSLSFFIYASKWSVS